MTALNTDIRVAAREGHTVGRAIWSDLGIDRTEPISYRTTDDLLAGIPALDYTVRLEPAISARTGQQLGKYQEVVHDGTDATIALVKNRYTVIQNRDAFGFLPEVCGEAGLTPVNGGVLGQGERYWLVAKAGEMRFEGRDLGDGRVDTVEKLLLFWGSHDGETSQRMAAIPHAIWCANALASTWRGEKGGARWSIPHTKNAMVRLQAAQKNVAEALGWMNGFTDMLAELERQRFDANRMRSYAEQVLNDVQGLLTPKALEDLGTKKDGTPKADTAVVARERNVEKLVDLFQGEGATCRGETKMDAYQAVTEFIDHHRRRAQKGRDAVAQAAARFEDTAFSKSSEDFRQKALRRLKA